MSEAAKNAGKQAAKRISKKLLKRAAQTKVVAGALAGLKVPLLILGGLYLAGMAGMFALAGIAYLVTPEPEETENQTSGWETGAITEFAKDEIPADYIPIYEEAGNKYNVPWNLLAAVHRVETRFSSMEVMVSPVGAIGHTQFMPLSWIGWSYPGGTRLGNADIPNDVLTDPEQIEKYGGYGTDANGDGKADPQDLEDAIHTTAKYLSENGVKDGNIEQAVFAYNQSQQYVRDVMGFADQYVNGYAAVEGKVASETIEGITWPVPSNTLITSTFGYRDSPGGIGSTDHKGIDIAGDGVNGSATVAIADGEVVFSGQMGGYGNAVYLDHGNGLTSEYGHLSAISVSEGDEVTSGDEVGKVGSTGNSTGPHLHLTIKVNGNSVDPLKYLDNFDYQMAQ